MYWRDKDNMKHTSWILIETNNECMISVYILLTKIHSRREQNQIKTIVCISKNKRFGKSLFCKQNAWIQNKNFLIIGLCENSLIQPITYIINYNRFSIESNSYNYILYLINSVIFLYIENGWNRNLGPNILKLAYFFFKSV